MSMLSTLSPRWRKALRDLWLNKARTLLVVAAMAIGIFGIAVVADAYAILTRELEINYLRTNPASATLYTDPLSDDLVQAARDLPQIGEAEARRTVVGRIQVGPDEWQPLWLYVIRDFADLRLDTFTPQAGTWPPARGELLLEREALAVAKAAVGDTVVVKLPDGPRGSLRLAGTVHAPGLAPAWMEGTAWGFITRDSLESLGGTPTLNELKIAVAENGMDKAAIRSTAYQLKDWVEAKGLTVYRIEVPEPGQHPHASQMATLLFLLEAFGLMALLLSGALVTTMISALLAQQIRQIGVMKAVGGSTRQITGLYLGMVLALGLAALAIAMPLGLAAGRIYAAFTAAMLNFEIFSYAVPFQTYALQAAVGLLVPLLAAVYPIYRGSRITVRQAIGDYGVGQGRFGRSAFDRLLGRIRGLPRPFLLSLRNTFRRRGRLILTLGALAAGGAIFVAAMNISASMNSSVASRFDATRYDVQVRFSRSYPVERVEQTIGAIPGVARVESWGGAKAARVYPDGTTGNSFNVVAPPEQTDLLAAPPLLAGRWLQPGDTNVLVINQLVLKAEPDVRVGDQVTLTIDQQKTTWQVVGIVREMMTPATAYATNEYFAGAAGQVGYARSAVVRTADRDAASVAGVTRLLEQKLAAAGLDVDATTQLAGVRKAIEDHFLVLASLLVMMSILVVVVGGLGLMSTMSVNVLERTREIGVLRAIGASTRTILGIVVAEGALIGVASWLVAVALALPVSAFIGYNFGMTFFEAPLEYAVSPLGFAIWLTIVVVFAAAASFYPAWNAARLTVREAVAYE